MVQGVGKVKVTCEVLDSKGQRIGIDSKWSTHHVNAYPKGLEEDIVLKFNASPGKRVFITPELILDIAKNRLRSVTQADERKCLDWQKTRGCPGLEINGSQPLPKDLIISRGRVRLNHFGLFFSCLDSFPNQRSKGLQFSFSLVFVFLGQGLFFNPIRRLRPFFICLWDRIQVNMFRGCVVRLSRPWSLLALSTSGSRSAGSTAFAWAACRRSYKKPPRKPRVQAGAS